MSVFTCDRCGYTTHSRQNLLTHLKRKNQCCSVYSNVTVDTLISKYTKVNKSTPSFACSYCSKPFSYRQSKHLHEKTCKYKDQDLQSKLISDLTQKLNQQTINNNTTNNNQCTTNNNCTTNHIQIISFGKESFDHLLQNKEFLTKCFHYLPKGMVTAVKHLYCNDAYPQFKNVKITNKKSKLLKVWDNNRWIERPKKDTLEEMVNMGKNLLDEHVHNHEEEIKHVDYRLFEKSMAQLRRIKDALNTDDSEHAKTLKNIIAELEASIINIPSK